MRENIIKNLEALASGLGKQDLDITYSFYSLIYNKLETQEEKDAFKYATLSMFADVGKMYLRRTFYDYKMKRAFKVLEEVERNG